MGRAVPLPLPSPGPKQRVLSDRPYLTLPDLAKSLPSIETSPKNRLDPATGEGKGCKSSCVLIKKCFIKRNGVKSIFIYE